ncbi:DMT family transporter [Sporosarcina obsidiansis]|uniref:DMT family transporter n=1 Tax=Sporosarcina obsidiansis TaxID=2660748 RepID=UPI00129AF068|nr:multidrug efflux SMR transporter [Sporosarcina obsidiansis]
MAWNYVILAAIVEIFWVVGLRYSDTMMQWIGTGMAIIVSFYCIIKACEKLPSGTVYAVFTGSGAAAILLVDIFVFQADFTWITLSFIALIVIGVVGIKLTTDEHVDEENQKGVG